ncbi:RidA family protein [Arthrobacter sp. LAR12-1-1.1]
MADTAAARGIIWTTQIPTRQDGALSPDIASQSRQILDNLRTALERAGSGLESVLHITIYFTDLRERQVFNDIYREYFPSPRPVRCAVGVNELGIPGMKVELTASAALTGS